MSFAATFDTPFASKPAWVAIGLSVAVHLVALLYLAVPNPLRHLPPTRLLVRFAVPAPVAAPVTPLPSEPAAEASKAPAPPAARPRVRNQRVATPPAVEETRAVDEAKSHGPLNFSLPSEVLDKEPAPPVDINGPFDPDIAKAVAKRQETRTRVAMAALRRAQREGVSSPDYERDVAAGHTIKTDSGCFDLRNEQSVDPNGQMWWRTPCREAHASVWEQDPITEAELHPSLREH